MTGERFYLYQPRIEFNFCPVPPWSKLLVKALIIFYGNKKVNLISAQVSKGWEKKWSHFPFFKLLFLRKISTARVCNIKYLWKIFIQGFKKCHLFWNPSTGGPSYGSLNITLSFRDQFFSLTPYASAKTPCWYLAWKRKRSSGHTVSHSSDVNLPFMTDVWRLGLATVRREIANHKK